jgi:hypothetical protein
MQEFLTTADSLIRKRTLLNCFGVAVDWKRKSFVQIPAKDVRLSPPKKINFVAQVFVPGLDGT